MKSSFNVVNVCGILATTNLHQDPELKSAAQEIIFERPGENRESHPEYLP